MRATAANRSNASVKSRLQDLAATIDHVAHLLPTQGPITTFVHHNTLHAFEDLHFDQAVKQGIEIFGCQPYFSEERFRELLASGRIQRQDLRSVLMEDLGETADDLVGLLGTRFQLRLAMLDCPLRMANSIELRWLASETNTMREFPAEVPRSVRERTIFATRQWVMRELSGGQPAGAEAIRRDVPHVEHCHPQQRLRAILSDLLRQQGLKRFEDISPAAWETLCLQLQWRLCHQGVHAIPDRRQTMRMPVRHRDALLAATAGDADQLVHDLLIRFCAAFVDQGLGTWTLPERHAGFYSAFITVYSQKLGPPQSWLRGLASELTELATHHITPLESIAISLDDLGVEPAECERFLLGTLLALRGWAGMLRQLETNAEWTRNPSPHGTLVEYLAIRLILDRRALKHVANETLAYHGSLSELRSLCHTATARTGEEVVEQRAFLVFQLSQFLGWQPEYLFHLPKDLWTRLVRELEDFGSMERRRVFQAAYERHYTTRALDAISVLNTRVQSAGLNRLSTVPVSTTCSDESQGVAKFQIVCCIDDREESFRRHLEEIEPTCQTFGAAGFFSVPMYYRGAADAHYLPLCPVVIKPKHWVQEDAVYTAARAHRRRSETRRAIGSATHRWHLGSRTFLGGMLTASLGTLAAIPLVTRILLPRTAAGIRNIFGRIVEPPATQLLLARSNHDPGPANGGLGFSLPEMAAMVERLLRDIGLTKQFAPLVIIAGHGSSSLNNPHESAYNCGACSGARGGPNARAFAQMANDLRVRNLLKEAGLQIPDDTWFLGAYHNTCNDSLMYFDLDRMPYATRAQFESAMRTIDIARQRNAHERCRRFESAPLALSPEDALKHVEARAEDLSQARPEYNHATNSLCIVGRRTRTRGLYLDRRAFLTSYDPTQDDQEGTILARILAAVVPVCSGISLEYYFSCVDPVGYGCGSKLPHNITSLLGVMEGAASDLRTGLSQQMTEIHEPLRILFVIETKPQVMLQIMKRNPVIDRFVRNRWVQLAVLDPDSAAIHEFTGDDFTLYQPQSMKLAEVEHSLDWYRGFRDHLEFSQITGTDSCRAKMRPHTECNLCETPVKHEVAQ